MRHSQRVARNAIALALNITEIPIAVLIALLVCLIPTTIGALISAIGIAGMDRLVQHNVLAMSTDDARGLDDVFDRERRCEVLRDRPGDVHSGVAPQLGVLNVMRLGTPESAILSAVIFNAVIIIGLIPLALKGIAYKPLDAAAILRRNLSDAVTIRQA